MNLKPIRTEKDLKVALSRLDEIIDLKEGTDEYGEKEILSILIEDYESKHIPIKAADPISVIKFIMEQRGLKRSDLASTLGGRNRVTEILSGKRKLTLQMIQALHKEFQIPYAALVETTIKRSRHRKAVSKSPARKIHSRSLK
jgi:HTH-type transcriptional regulator/antitoxin HigA